MNELKYSACPDLPQYGRLLAACPADLPSKASWMAIVGALLAFFFSTGLIKVGLDQQANVPEHITAIASMGGGLLIAIILYYVLRRANGNKQALFVFDGGIHLNEDVTFMLADGSSISINSGMRQVSIPWRLVHKFSVKELSRKGQSIVQASMKIPDGRTLILSTDSGHESGTAIKTLIEKLDR